MTTPKLKVGDHVHVLWAPQDGKPIEQGSIVEIGPGSHPYRVQVGTTYTGGMFYSAEQIAPLGTLVGETVRVDSGITGIVGEVLRYDPYKDSVCIKTGPTQNRVCSLVPYEEFCRSMLIPIGSEPKPEPKTDIRDRLAECFRDYAKQALEARQWEAATAYLRAADIAEAFGLTTSEPKR